MNLPGRQKVFSTLSLYATMVTKATTKKAVRREITERLKCLSTEEKQTQSKIVFEKLIHLPSFQKSKRVSTYLSIDNEIDTEPVVRKIFETGKECFVPRYSKAGMEMVKINSYEDWQTLPVTSWGIKQPNLKEQREDALKTGGLDFIVVPGVGFTAKGLRLGHGGGYYDKYLVEIKKHQDVPPALVALAFKEQIVDDLPVTEMDVQIDLVLYPE
ncbi:5-formyltetrahydrofolate cyclo-ligase [Tribolium madens]|uniref:5-formyltetrahydrofolate cyclo-ligase n=1 Tax=Tribolium madens TaxID=41895 RepID=UPI001CF72B37|nr:5-formyltetrahydrofolate cyclo-ligase [Tribolium madens]XP_044264360.1 5-formyltetrahydrofolate cyclo-ligase [Tribolium madens]